MAKIKYYRPGLQELEVKEISSIVGDNYLKKYKERLRKHTEFVHIQHRALVEAEKIGKIKSVK